VHRVPQPNWKTIVPFAALGGVLLVGVAGLLLGPLVVGGFVLLQRRRAAAQAGLHHEDGRLAAFMADAAQQARALGAIPALQRKPTFEELRARGLALEGRALLEAYALARLALAENGCDAHAAAESALLSRRAADGPQRSAVRARDLTRALGVCLANGQAAMAAALFCEAGDERASLALAQAQCIALGRALVAQHAYREAAWVLHDAALRAGDAGAAQRRLVEIAGRAGEAGRGEDALHLYQAILERYPDTPFAEFVHAGIRQEERRRSRVAGGIRTPGTSGPG
jgi:hypothetical protein